MKRYSLIGLLTVLVAVTVWAAIIEVPEAPAGVGVSFLGGGGAAVATCSTARLTEDGASVATITNGVAARQYMATKIVAEADYTVCAIDLWLTRTGSPTMNLQACIYSHDAGEDDPNTAIDCSDNVAASGIPTSETQVAFSAGLSAALTNGTTYWVVFASSAVQDTSNHVAWHVDATGATQRMVNDADASGAWTLIGTGDTFKFKLYSN